MLRNRELQEESLPSYHIGGSWKELEAIVKLAPAELSCLGLREALGRFTPSAVRSCYMMTGISIDANA